MNLENMTGEVSSGTLLDNCPFLIVQKLLSGKWSLLVLCFLRNGPLRFGELQRYMPDLTQTTLTKTLRKLESDGMITRKIYPVVPPKVEYSLSEIGTGIIPVLDALGEYSMKYLSYFGHGDKICSEVSTGSCRCCKNTKPSEN